MVSREGSFSPVVAALDVRVTCGALASPGRLLWSTCRASSQVIPKGTPRTAPWARRPVASLPSVLQHTGLGSLVRGLSAEGEPGDRPLEGWALKGCGSRGPTGKDRCLGRRGGAVNAEFLLGPSS